MTLVVVELRKESVHIVADTLVSLVGPCQVPHGSLSDVLGTYRIEGETLSCEAGQSVRARSHHPYFQKVKLSEDLSEAFAFSGSRDPQEPFLGITTETSLDADEAIWSYFTLWSEIETGPTISPGEYPAISGLHVYEIEGRFIATSFDASVAELSRRCKRSSKEEVHYVAIGSGASHLQDMISRGPLTEAWKRYCSKAPSAAERLAFWCAAFLLVSNIVDDVGPEILLWSKTSGQSFKLTGPCTGHPGLYRSTPG